jgi:hypothetical protein
LRLFKNSIINRRKEIRKTAGDSVEEMSKMINGVRSGIVEPVCSKFAGA